MRILITGATGAIGGRLVQKLRRHTEDEITILIRKPHADNNTIARSNTVNGDLRQIDTLVRASKGIDTVIHLAAITHTHNTRTYDEINRFGTENMIQAAQRCGVMQFIFLSTRTASYIGGAYAKSKIRAEESLIRSRLNWTIIRPAEIYGMQSNDAIQKMIDIVNKGYPLPIVGKGNYILAPVFVDDVVNGIVSTIGNHKATRTIYVFKGPEEYTLRQIVEILENQSNKKIQKIYLPVFLVKILAFVLFLFRSKILYRDQIDRLLCQKVNGADGSFDDLGINPRQFEDEIKTICQKF